LYIVIGFYDGKGLTAKRVNAALDRHSCSWSRGQRERERERERERRCASVCSSCRSYRDVRSDRC